MRNRFHRDRPGNTFNSDGYIPHTRHDNAPQPGHQKYNNYCPLKPLGDPIINRLIGDHFSFEDNNRKMSEFTELTQKLKEEMRPFGVQIPY